MRGSIRQYGKINKSWQISFYTGEIVDGKRARYYEVVKGRKQDAQTRLNELLVNQDKGIPTPKGHLTLAELLHQWLKGYVKTNASPRTYEGYSSIIEHHLIPSLGQIQLKYLQSKTIEDYYGQQNKTLSARSVLHQHRVLSQALKYGVRHGFLGRNPAEFTEPPKPRKTTMRTLTADEVEILLNSVRDSNYYPVIYTAVSSGLLQAEILGLRWRDIDLDMCSISVCQTLYIKRGIVQFKEPKTAHSRRRVSMTPKLALFLKEFKAKREEKKGLPVILDAIVFTTVKGAPIDAHLLSHAFGLMSKKAGLGHLRFHDLRHTFASLMLQHGAKPKVISECLGHASVGFTMDVYSHIIEGMQQDAMALLDEVLPVGVFKSNNVKLTLNSDIMFSNN